MNFGVRAGTWSLLLISTWVPTLAHATTLYLSSSGSDDSSSDIFALTNVTTSLPEKRGEAGIILTDLAWHSPTHTLYGIDYFSALWKINATTGQGTRIDQTGYRLYALTFCGDTLYGWGDTNLVTLNPQTALATLIGNVGYVASGDLACANDGTLYGSAEGTTTDRLIRLSRSTGKGTLIGELPFSQVLAMAFDSDGTLYGLTGTLPPKLFSINVYSGALIESFGALELDLPLYGATLDPDDGTGCTLDEPPVGLYAPDEDGDAFGDESSPLALYACEEPLGFTLTSGDCNDAADHTYPGAQELCDDQDNDCDGTIDEGALGAVACYVDGDLDGFGIGNPYYACTCPAGYSPLSGDCDDRSPAISPSQEETCDGEDNNCNGTVDEDLETLLVYEDLDGDGYGNPDQALATCDLLLEGYSSNNLDCNDFFISDNPDGEEVADGRDNDCDGDIDEFVMATPSPTPEASPLPTPTSAPTPSPDVDTTTPGTSPPAPSPTPTGTPAPSLSPEPEDGASGCSCTTAARTPSATIPPSGNISGWMLMGVLWHFGLHRRGLRKRRSSEGGFQRLP